jgi:hypothetical protein
MLGEVQIEPQFRLALRITRSESKIQVGSPVGPSGWRYFTIIDHCFVFSSAIPVADLDALEPPNS